MFSFSKLGNYGRLGNQFFQIAATIGLATKHSVKYAFPEWTYQPYFEKKLPVHFNIQGSEVSEPHFHYGDLILDRGRDLDLMGYFQSEKYFEAIREEIKKYFSFKDDFLISVAEKLQLPEEENINGKPWCAISVRRGDYVGNANYANLDKTYYTNATKCMPEDCTFIVFSDDLPWCKEHLGQAQGLPRPVFTDGFNEIESMALLSLCDHFIIANSTFSWWGAWLGEKPHSKIIAPDDWFGEGLKHKSNTKDIIPERWTKVPVKQEENKSVYQIDLSDVTFTIPVRLEHNDRKENIEFIICFLQRHFHCKIMVGEQDVTPKLEFLKQFCDYKFYQCEGAGLAPAPMHRTKLLNMMARAADTDIIFNYDTDVLFQPEQILEAVNKIRKGELDGCYPYDGRFVRLERKYLWVAHKTLSLEELEKVELKKHEEQQVSYGGAVAWKRESFISGGMENENFISFGPEDYERYDRFTALGYKVGRVPGKLFHINHFIGVDSNGENPHFKANEQEWLKVKSMNKETLQQYISTWPWVISLQEIKAENLSDRKIKQVIIDNDNDTSTLLVEETKKSPLLNIGIDRIFCVNLEKRTDRKEYAICEFRDHNIFPVEFIPAIDGRAQGLTSKISRLTPGMLGCYESHRRLIKHALDKGYNTICVFEDDLQLIPGFNELMSIAARTIPDDWQFIYLGYQEYGGFGDYKHMINEHWVIPKCVWGTQGYMIIGKDTMEYLLKALEKQEMQLDEQLANLILPNSGLKYYAIFPSVVGQNFEKFGSDIQDKQEIK
jgi:GR25 family glycosyltransferase involved in LPS biosynthesis